MSLINDALQRAKAAQQQQRPPSAEHLPLRPVDPQVAVTHGIGLVMPAGFAVVALLLLFFVWRFYMDKSRDAKADLTVAARTSSVPEQVALPVAAAPPARVPADSTISPITVTAQSQVQTPPAAQAPSAPQVVPLPSVTNSPGPAPQSPLPDPAKAVAGAVTVGSNSPAPEAVTPALPPLKLQGVSYSRTRPSAIISGKTVFVGDRVRDLRVLSIGVETVTLANSARTNVLLLSD